MDVSAGIPTRYAGTNFRSRLEARWAAMFSGLGWRWTYEPVDAEGYIPDFLIHGKFPMFVEVGACITEADYADKAQKANDRSGILGHDLLVVGVSPVANFSDDYLTAGHIIGGWLGEYGIGWDLEIDAATGPYLAWNWGVWGQCYDCRAIGIVHTEMSYSLRPCGHHQSGGFGRAVGDDELSVMWRRAGNDVQWRGPQRIGDMFTAPGR